MAIMDVKTEQNTNFSWYDVPYVMTMPKNPSKLEEAAKTAASKLDGEQENVLALVENKIAKDMAVMQLWVERMKDKEAMAQGALRAKKLSLKNAGRTAALTFVESVLDFKEQSDANLAGIISLKNSVVQAHCSNPLSGKNGASSIIVIDMNALDPAAQRRKLTAGMTLVTGNEARDVAVVLLPWDRETSFSTQVVCLGPPKVLHNVWSADVSLSDSLVSLCPALSLWLSRLDCLRDGGCIHVLAYVCVLALFWACAFACMRASACAIECARASECVSSSASTCV